MDNSNIDIPTARCCQSAKKEFCLNPIPLVRVAFIGLGERGQLAVRRWCNLQHVSIVALCDVNQDNVEAANSIVKEYNLSSPALYHGDDGYSKLCLRDDVDLVYICTTWQSHVVISLCAMEAGKNVAVEVPAALTVGDAWSLVECAERKRVHCMMLENSVYDFFEIAVQKMALDGLFGDIIHAEGGYAHELCNKWTPWRIEYNRTHKGDVYPTHGLGPVCKAMGIHYVDKLDFLVSVESKSFLGRSTYKDIMGTECEDFMNGDQTTTIIRTVCGRTITINHNVLSPRPYDRMFQLVGTHGYVAKYPVAQIYLDECASKHAGIDFQGGLLSEDQVGELLSKYTPDYVKELRGLGEKLDSRGGMSLFMDYRLVKCLNDGKPLDMDVYDLAEWCSISELSRLSIEQGSVPVKIPDFTEGR